MRHLGSLVLDAPDRRGATALRPAAGGDEPVPPPEVRSVEVALHGADDTGRSAGVERLVGPVATRLDGPLQPAERAEVVVLADPGGSRSCVIDP